MVNLLYTTVVNLTKEEVNGAMLNDDIDPETDLIFKHIKPPDLNKELIQKLHLQEVNTEDFGDLLLIDY